MNTPFTVLATGDNHFDEYSPRWQETLRVHQHIVARARELGPSLVAIPGDLNERRSTARERLEQAAFLMGAAEVAPVLLVAGNHDPPEELALYASLRSTHPIVVVEDARVVEIAGAAIACVAWPRRAGAIDDGVAREQLRSVLRGLGVELAERGRGRPRLAVGHFDTDGAKTGAGQPLIGGSIRVTLADIALMGAQATIMSHVHMAQEWLFDGAPILYTGSSVAHDYGETDPKSFLRLEVEGDRVTYARESTQTRALLLGEADWDPDGPGWIWRDDATPLSCLSPAEISGADIRFRYHVRADLLAIARQEAAGLRARLLAAGAARVTPEPITEASVRAREGALAVVAARTLEEKMEAVWAARNDVPEPTVAARLKSKLQQLQRHELPQGA